MIVLCGGVLTGIVGACELLGQLALHRVVPSVFLRHIPLTGSPYVSVLSFMTFSVMLYASAGASLTVISEIFSFVWLTVMSLFPISLLLLKFNRERLPRDRKTSFFVLMVTLILVPVVFAGNIAVNPRTTECAFAPSPSYICY
jgi:amino acid transporter